MLFIVSIINVNTYVDVNEILNFVLHGSIGATLHTFVQNHKVDNNSRVY